MKLWYVKFDNEKKDDFPQLFFKDNYINIKKQSDITFEIKRIFLLTHRDATKKINEIYSNTHKLPYKDLHNLVFPEPNYEFQTEYLVDLLNLFEIVPLSLD
jgi:hypothetical protein